MNRSIPVRERPANVSILDSFAMSPQSPKTRQVIWPVFGWVFCPKSSLCHSLTRKRFSQLLAGASWMGEYGHLAIAEAVLLFSLSGNGMDEYDWTVVTDMPKQVHKVHKAPQTIAWKWCFTDPNHLGLELDLQASFWLTVRVLRVLHGFCIWFINVHHAVFLRQCLCVCAFIYTYIHVCIYIYTYIYIDFGWAVQPCPGDPSTSDWEDFLHQYSPYHLYKAPWLKKNGRSW